MNLEIEAYEGELRKLRQALAMKKFSEVNQEIEEALKQQKQEPVAYVTIENISSWSQVPSIKWFKKPTEGPLYTAPPKRTWVGLAEEELEDLLNTIPWPQIFRAIEAKLKEKNT